MTDPRVEEPWIAVKHGSSRIFQYATRVGKPGGHGNQVAHAEKHHISVEVILNFVLNHKSWLTYRPDENPRRLEP